MRLRLVALALAAAVALSISPGCSKQNIPQKQASAGSPAASGSGLMVAINKAHPLAKHLELAGFRLSEKSAGKLAVRVAVVNHSEADIADLGLDIFLKPSTAKEEDQPFCKFSLKLPALLPREMKDAEAECPTTLRVYELPDWQFIRGSFQITSPTP